MLHVINNLGSGGAENLISEMLPIMNNIKGVEVDLLLLTDKNNVFDKKLKEKGIKIEIVPKRKLYSPYNIFYIKDFIIKNKYDIVHAHLFPTIYWVSLASKLIFKNKPKFIMTEHSTHNKRREKKYLRFLERKIHFNYDKIISISQKAQENLILWLNPNEKHLNKFIIIENGINVEKFIKAKPYLKREINKKFTEDIKLICMVSRFSEQKDHPTVIKSLKELPENVHLILVGEGKLKSKNIKLASEIGVNKRVHFLGFRNDIPRILKTVDVVVLSSNWEGFGLAAVEGMSAGLPVIASDVPGLNEIVKNAGLLFSKGNSSELASKINELIMNRDKYNEISKKCLFKAYKYDIRKMTKNYINLYEQFYKSSFK
ncbi:glycosyltransferase [Marinitoga sp. 1154]|uniref:glycosyltransferase n=1 Tax=Marinitoga sp. 1154 TaxID=1643335 RepID=UPI0034C62C09